MNHPIRCGLAEPSGSGRAWLSQRLFWHLPGFGCCATRYSWEIRFPIPLAGLTNLVGLTSAPDWPYDEMKNAEFEWVPASWQWLLYPRVEGHRLHQNFKFSSGLGPFFAATVPVVWVLWGALLAREPWRRFLSDGDRATRILYLFGTIVFLAW